MEYDLAVAIRCQPDTVWRFIDDVQDYIHQKPGSPVNEMEKIPPGPARVGTRWREVIRLLPGVTMTMWSEVIAVEAGRRLEETFRGPWMSGLLEYEIETTPGGCVLHMRETLTPHGLLRLLAGPMDAALRPRLEKRLVDIRDGLEGDRRSG